MYFAQTHRLFRKALHFFCILIFALSFLIQQLLAFSGPLAVVGHADRYHFHEGAGLAFMPQLNPSLPPQHLRESIDMELETAETDDSKSDFDDASDSFSHLQAGQEHVFSCSLRIRLQRLSASSHLQKPIPKFILHHSWKAYLG